MCLRFADRPCFIAADCRPTIFSPKKKQKKKKRVRCPALLDSPVGVSYRKLSNVPVYKLKLTYLVVEVCISHSPLIKTPISIILKQ